MRYSPSDNGPGKCFKDHDLQACTWNIRYLNEEGDATQLNDVLDKIKADKADGTRTEAIRALFTTAAI